MPSNRTIKWGGAAILLLILINIVSYFYYNWGLITVKVHDAPLGKVVRSIEWQGWVKIYTNLPADTKVSMWVDHVPLAEAMETLAVNVGGRPNGSENRGDRPPRDGGGPGGNPPPGAPGAPGVAAAPANASNTNAPAATPPPAPGGVAGNGSGGPPGGGGPGGGPGGRGGFGGGGASWNLAFFVAPTSAQVKAEIQAFQSGSTDEDTKVYTYQTPLQMLASDPDMPASDPCKQSWPGYIQRAPDTNPPAADGQAPVAPAAPTTPNIQTYLQAFAESSNIWIMAPGSWATDVGTPPPANPSIIKAIKNFVSGHNGAVTEAIVLRVGRGARGGGNRGGFGGGGFADMDVMTERMKNAINGLPPEARADALSQLDQEVQFYQQVKAAAPDDRRKMVADHMMDKMANAPGLNRMSPEKRAARYERAVSNREAVRGN